MSVLPWQRKPSLLKSTRSDCRQPQAIKQLLLSEHIYLLVSAAGCGLLARATSLRSSFEVPHRCNITPAFATDELVVLNFQYSGHLWDSYQAARVKGFQNAMGKFCFVELGNFLINIHALCLYTSACSTNPKGDVQPGNFLVILTDECRELRANSTPKIRKQQWRIADYVMYDRRNDMYSIVGEIKSDARDDAEVQNVEQMVGLFRQRQQAMLGFTCNKEAITLRILIQHQDTLRLTVLPPLSLAEEEYSESMRKLAQLFLAFISIVNIAL